MIHVIDHVMLPPTGDIVDIVSNTPELSTLLSLVSQAGLAGALKGMSISRMFIKKQVSMINKYHNQTLQTNSWHREEKSLKKKTVTRHQEARSTQPINLITSCIQILYVLKHSDMLTQIRESPDSNVHDP